MGLTQADLDRIDESPSYSSGGRIIAFGFAEKRARSASKPAWRVAAEDRRAQLELMAYQMEREETL
jgi:hypothetical protein